MKQLDLKDDLRYRRTFGVLDDFLWMISPHYLTTLATDVGATAAVGDAAGGVLTLTSGAVDNNEAAVFTTNELFLFAADKPMVCEARVQYAEAATNAANVCVGFANAFGADLLVDNGAGPKASFSGALIYKVDSATGGTVWKFRTSVGTANTDTASTTTAGGAAYQTLRVEVREAGALMEAVPFVDDKQLLDANFRPVKHTFAIGAATEMNAGVYVKAGTGASQVVLVDYLAAYGLR